MGKLTAFKSSLNKYVSVPDMILCIALAFACSYASAYRSVPQETNTVIIILRAIVFSALFILGILLFRLILDHGAVDENRTLLASIFNNRRSFWLTAGIIFTIYLIMAIFLYPGTLANDTWGQLQSSVLLRYGTWHVSALHPVFNTFLYGLVILPLVQLFGWQPAIFVYVVIQISLYSLTFAYTLDYAKKKLHLSNRVLTGFLIFYCAVPAYPIIGQSVSNDAISGWLYVLVIVKIIEIIRAQGKPLEDKKEFVEFLLVLVFCILSKKIEAYVLLLSLAVVCAVVRDRKRVLVGILAAVITAFIFIPSVTTAFSIKQDAPSEMLNLPYQMTASYVKAYPNDVTSTEKKAISKVLDYDTLAKDYTPTNADAIRKRRYEGFADYFKAWFAMGLRHPDAYLVALAEHEAGWFSFSEYRPPTTMAWHSQLNPQLIPEETAERNNLSFETETMVESVHHFLYKIPILGLVFTYAFWAILAPLLVLCTMIRACWKSRQRKKYYLKRNGVYRTVSWRAFSRKIHPKYGERPLQLPAENSKYWVIALPLILSFMLGCLNAPVSVHIEGLRYAYPLVLSLPITLMACFYMRRQQIPSANEQNKSEINESVNAGLSR
ncbi:DUF6020 family protein [Parascardovia denticolens]